MSDFRPIPGWSTYEVSENGVVRRRIKSPTGHTDERKPYLTSTGYLYLVLRQPGSRKGMAIAVHRLVALAFLGKPPSLEHAVAHSDGDKLNNHYSNLRWATRSENEHDKVRHGKSNRGERCGTAKLSSDAVLAVRRELGTGISQKRIAAKFGISPQLVSRIKLGTTWTWLLENAV